MDPHGGLGWVEKAKRGQHSGPATGSTIELGLQLYLSTCDRAYLDEALRNYGYLRDHLRRSDGLYIDKIFNDGTKDGSIYSYNQGTAIGSDVLLYKATGSDAYLAEAKKTALATLAKGADWLWSQPPAFNAIFFRNLMALNAEAPDDLWVDALEAYLTRLSDHARDPKTGLYDRGGIGHYGKSAPNLIDQSAIVQMFALRGPQNCPATKLAKTLAGPPNACKAGNGPASQFLAP